MVLFGELAQAVKLNMPLDEALSRACQNLAERGVGGSLIKRGANTRFNRLNVFLGFIYGLSSFCFGLIAYLPFAFRFADVERVARLLALKLLPLVQSGIPLSKAMKSCDVDYTEQEVALVEVGESTDNLATALRELSQSQAVARRLSVMSSGVAMPLMVFPAALMIVSYILMTITPKFQDIFRQLGIPANQLGGFTYLTSYTSSWEILFFITIILFLVIVVPITWLMMNGNTTSIVILAIQCLGALYIISYSLSEVILDVLQSSFTGVNDAWWLVILFGLMMIGILLLPGFLKGVEYILLKYESYGRRMVGWLPVIGRAVRIQEETAWLGTLAMAVSAGCSAEESLQMAGKRSQYFLRKKSIRAAELAGKGLEIGSACQDAKVLSSHINARLFLLDGRSDYAEGIGTLARDMAEDAYDVLQRSARVVEVAAFLLYGIVVGFFVVALYYPLFLIPILAMGH